MPCTTSRCHRERPGLHGSRPAKGLQDHQGWRVGTDRPVEYQRTLANGMDSFLPPTAKLSLQARGATVSVSRDAGMRWQTVSAGSDETELLEQVAGVSEYLVKVDLNGPEALLSSLVIETITQLNRAGLQEGGWRPALRSRCAGAGQPGARRCAQRLPISIKQAIPPCAPLDSSRLAKGCLSDWPDGARSEYVAADNSRLKT